MKIVNCKLKIAKRAGFTLIELLVAMFIFIVIMGAMVAVSLSGFRSYIKSRAIKTVTEDVGFAINSIAKDVRMGKIDPTPTTAACSGGKCLVLTRNVDQTKICYIISSTLLRSCDSDCTSNCKNIVSLDSTMSFSSNSRFYSCPTDTSDTVSSACFGTTEKGRGWAEINLNIESPGMETDSISVQTIVSSRDYGWEDL